MAVIEYARNVVGLKGANSTEMDIMSSIPVIDLMESQKSVLSKGGTMRLGSWNCELIKNSLVYSIYQKDKISERHRHRYEFNNAFSDQIFDKNFKVVGTNPETKLVEIIENAAHPWFVGVQFHPEYESTVAHPHPLFVSFIKAALTHTSKKQNNENGRKKI